VAVSRASECCTRRRRPEAAVETGWHPPRAPSASHAHHPSAGILSRCKGSGGISTAQPACVLNAGAPGTPRVSGRPGGECSPESPSPAWGAWAPQRRPVCRFRYLRWLPRWETKTKPARSRAATASRLETAGRPPAICPESETTRAHHADGQAGMVTSMERTSAMVGEGGASASSSK